ncbi:hypothetical protein [Pseudomonas putida]|uniref:Pyruvate kinase n=1 Tax=Pseudomonas putida TaxID=303 RepID=A0A1L7NPV0_PSEPU|nr:hypothetical protein [Pseudomonas putida]BAW27499.1 Pyruvate kinase [Pseudomonas putida]
MSIEPATVMNLVLLAVIVYQAMRLAGAKAALAKAGVLLQEANTRLLELLEHVKTQETFINDLLEQLPPAIEPHPEKQA